MANQPEMPDDPDELSDFETLVWFENGKRYQTRRPRKISGDAKKVVRAYKLDPMSGFIPGKKILPPPPPGPRYYGVADDDALHDLDEVGDPGRLGVHFDVDWDYLLTHVDFTKNKWWEIKVEFDEVGGSRKRVIEIDDRRVNGVLADFVRFSDDPITARYQRIWLKRMFR